MEKEIKNIEDIKIYSAEYILTFLYQVKDMEKINELINQFLKSINEELNSLHDKISDLENKEKLLKQHQQLVLRKIEFDKFQNDSSKLLRDIAKEELKNATDGEFKKILQEAIEATDKVIKKEDESKLNELKKMN